MLFVKNGLSLQHNKGFGVRFCPIEALKTVNAKEDLVHVAMSKEWLEARSDHADINKIAKRYDWTYTPSNYKGCLLNENSGKSGLEVSLTEEKIDYERLKVQERIVFFDEIILYEDELDDNGIAKLSIKIVSLLNCNPYFLKKHWAEYDFIVMNTYKFQRSWSSKRVDLMIRIKKNFYHAENNEIQWCALINKQSPVQCSCSKL